MYYIISKTPLCNGNCPITNLITEMGVAHTVGPSEVKFQNTGKLRVLTCFV
jgi:hypothetical protein